MAAAVDTAYGPHARYRRVIPRPKGSVVLRRFLEGKREEQRSLTRYHQYARQTLWRFGKLRGAGQSVLITEAIKMENEIQALCWRYHSGARYQRSEALFCCGRGLIGIYIR